MPKIILIVILILLSLITSSKAYSSTDFQKHQNNPLINIPNNSWTVGISMPSLIINSNKYELYFTGYNKINELTRFSIGYATSYSGLDWNVFNQSIHSKIAINKDVHDQTILYENGLYYMWYITSENGGTTNFKLFRSVSIDGNNWHPNDTINQISPQNSFIAGLISAPYVLHTNTGYELWFSSLTNLGIWQIGHATSPDGLNWTQDSSNPVLIGQTSLTWEGSNVNGPTVIKDSSGYHMWYVTGTVNGKQNIAYAFSETGNGKSWIKPPDKNPVVVPGSPGEWDSGWLGDASAIKINDSILLYYAAYGPYNGVPAARIGLAYNGTLPTPFNSPTPTPIPTPSFTPSPTPSETPTPTPSPLLTPTNTPTPTLTETPSPTNTPTHTPTPTNTPTPTSTPTNTPTHTPTSTPTSTPTLTPTPPPVDKVVIIPGLGGSWNLDAIKTCTLDDNPTHWSKMNFGPQIYDVIGDEIYKNNYSVKYFYYDWRQDPRITAQKLNDMLQLWTAPEEHVYIIGHSLGGLVARAYAEQFKELSKAEKIMTVGTPHAGVVSAYPAWSADVIHGDILWRIAGELVKTTCMQTWGTYSGIIRKHMPSASVLLPTFSYLVDADTRVFKPIDEMKAKNPWLSPASFTEPFYGMKIGNLAGTSIGTEETIIINPPSKIDIKRERYGDGALVKFVKSNQGDGTVLKKSSLMDGTIHSTLLADHQAIIHSSHGIHKILDFLEIGQTSSVSAINPIVPQSALAILSDDEDFELLSNGKTVRKSEKGLIILFDADGDYELKIKPGLFTHTYYLVALSDNDQAQTKVMSLGKLLPSKIKVHINKHDADKFSIN